MPIVYILMTGCTRHLHIFCNNSYNCLLLIYRTIHFEFKTQYRHLVDRTYEGVGWSDWKAYGISHIHISWLSRQTDVLGLVTFSVRTILHTLLDTQPRTSISWLNHDLARHGYHISKLMLRQGGRTNEGRLITVNKQCRLLIEGEGGGGGHILCMQNYFVRDFLNLPPSRNFLLPLRNNKRMPDQRNPWYINCVPQSTYDSRGCILIEDLW